MAKVTIVFEDSEDTQEINVKVDFSPEIDMKIPPTHAQQAAVNYIEMLRQMLEGGEHGAS